MRLRARAMVTIACTAAAGVGLLTAWRRSTSADVQGPSSGQPMPPNRETSPRNAKRDQPLDQPNAQMWRPLRPLLLLVVAAVFTGIAVVSLKLGNTTVSYVAFLITMAIVAFLLRGPHRRQPVVLIVLLVVLFGVQLVDVVVASAAGSFLSTDDPLSFLVLTIFAIFGLAIIVCLAATWVPKWRFSEPVSMGLIALSLGALCVPGLRFATEPLSLPNDSGSVLLFITGPTTQRIAAYASFISITSQDAVENIQVSPLTKGTAHWALLLTGNARLKKATTSRNVMHVTFSASPIESYDSPNTRGQLFFGRFDKSLSSSSISGKTVGGFSDSTSDRTAVALPYYGQAGFSVLSGAARKTVIQALKGRRPVLRSAKYFTANMYSGPESPLDSVTAANQSPTTNSSLSGLLHWTIHLANAITYSTVDQQLTDVTNNSLFVFAILLGVAGAVLVASLQGIIHALVVHRDSSMVEEK